jgi:hypothetical protein
VHGGDASDFDGNHHQVFPPREQRVHLQDRGAPAGHEHLRLNYFHHGYSFGQISSKKLQRNATLRDFRFVFRLFCIITNQNQLKIKPHMSN